MEATDMKKVKENLSNLEKIFLSQERFVYEFAKYFGSRLNDKLIPIEFIIEIKLTLLDISTGSHRLAVRRGDTSQKFDAFGNVVPQILLNKPAIVYVALETIIIPRILELVLPEDFLIEVQNAIEVINDHVKEMMKK